VRREAQTGSARIAKVPLDRDAVNHDNSAGRFRDGVPAMMTKLAAIVTFTGALVLAAHGATAEDKDVADELLASKEHTILVTAVKEAGLVESLKSKGPITLFAPTDAAFRNLGDDTIQAMVKDKTLVKNLVQAHIVEGKLTVAELAKLDGQQVKTLGGTTLKVAGKNGTTVGDAKLAKADVACKNGTFLSIDRVLPLR
jgi:uncharacterized surface protein with fasciclin (FAS1) repeats